MLFEIAILLGISRISNAEQKPKDILYIIYKNNRVLQSTAIHTYMYVIEAIFRLKIKKLSIKFFVGRYKVYRKKCKKKVLKKYFKKEKFENIFETTWNICIMENIGKLFWKKI